MNRPPVCHYYQAGSCRNGDLCPFTHPTVRCREFSSTGWCPYGFNCHFWHDPSQTRPNNLQGRKPCQFFALGQCKYGDRCSFSHDLKSDGGSMMTLAEYKSSKRKPKLKLRNRSGSPRKSPSKSVISDLSASVSALGLQSPSIGKNQQFNSRAPVSRPDRHLISGGTNKSEISRLQNLEISRLLKAHADDKLQEVDSSGDGRVFFLRFASTDPDWAYDVREIVLSIHIVRMYPVDPLKITVLPKDYLPNTLVEHLNTSIQSWISVKHKQARQNNRTEIYLRSFLQWLDRNLENLFTQGLRKYKAELLEKSDSASIKPVSSGPSPLTGPLESNHPGTGDESEVPHNELQSASEGDDLNSSETDESTASSCIGSESDDSSHVDPFESIPGEWVEPVHPETTQSEIEPTVDKELLDKLLKPKDDTPLEQKASQHLYLTDLRLFGKAGTALQRRLTVSLHCTRCRLAFTWIFTLRHNPVGGAESSIEPSHLRSVPPHTSTCARCRQPMNLVFQAVLMHSFSNTAGSLHLGGCVADDVPPKLSEFLLTCIECNKVVNLSGVESGRRVNKRCTVCHSLVGLEFAGFRLEMVKGVGEQVGTVARTEAEQTSLSRKLRHALHKAQNQLIQDGVPLPDFGVCKHYRKSHRWLRFPCCGRAEPCDVCHDQAAVDGHEMEMATRMICGYCAKEQPFSNTKPCVRCGKYLCGSRSAHWEGGKGCRNKVTMSRKDAKKYSQQNKTVSRNKTKS